MVVALACLARELGFVFGLNVRVHGRIDWSGRLNRLRLELVENAVDEARRIDGAESACQFNRLVNGRGGGSLRGEQDFVGPHPQDVAIDYGHAGQTPVFGDLAQPGVDFSQVGVHAIDQAQTKSLQPGIAQAVFGEALELRVLAFGMKVKLKQKLQCDFART